ncbi:MAG: hypothetical protein ACYDB9_06675 [Gammaproteobacteria bacterium]
MDKILLMLACFCITGQGAAAKPACAAPAYRQLDFWLGDWDVYDNDGRGPVVARDRVASILDNCVVLERYTQFGGITGESFNIYDQSRHVWHQTWVTNRGALLVLEGRFKDGVLTEYAHSLNSRGRAVQWRATWRLQGHGVRETAYISKDDGKTWNTDFDLLFLKHHPAKSPL